jgi:periplasmic divalent cation tolerance protein
MIYILWSAASETEAKTIARSLLTQRLIACASFFPVHSIYRWQDQIEASAEIKVLLKTLPHHFPAISDYIHTHGQYTTPEITQIKGNPTASYLAWLQESVLP